MKKPYVKPTVEIEEFVANEYVAACYIVTCTKGPSDIVVLDSPPVYDTLLDFWFKDKDGFVRNGLGTKKYYRFTLHGKESCVEVGGQKVHELAKDPQLITDYGTLNPGTAYERNYGPNSSI